MAKVSVIVPNYNHAKHLDQRLTSIFNQTYEDYQVILLDDASTDESVKMLKQYADHPKVSHIAVNDKNSGGPFHQWKKGIELAKGEYIWIAESDDWAELNFLDQMMNIAMANPSATVVYCQSNKVNESGDVVGNNLYWTNDLDSKRWKSNYSNIGIDECKHYLSSKNIIPNASGVLFKRRQAIKIDWSFIDFKQMGDWFFWIKMLENGDLCYLSKSLNYFRFSQNNTRQYKTITQKLDKAVEELAILRYLMSRKIVKRSIFRKQAKLTLKALVLLGVGIGSLKGHAYTKTLDVFFGKYNGDIPKTV